MKTVSQFSTRTFSTPPPEPVIRCARLIDITHIDACNRATLPENYHREFYEEQIQKWPELALVAINDKNEMVLLILSKCEIVVTPPPLTLRVATLLTDGIRTWAPGGNSHAWIHL
jgi:hypothetical protein